MKEIVNAVISEKMFGAVECDIVVPEVWPPIVRNRDDFHEKFDSKTPMEYFSEMSPLFVTTEVPFESIGAHMQKHVLDHGLSKKPRKLLVGGLRAKKILLATPLLRWYLLHGLEVTRIYTVIEFGKKKCFDDFAQKVTEGRRAGVASGSKLMQDSWKLIG